MFVPILIVTNKSDHIIIFLLLMVWTTVLLSMNLIPITTKTLSIIILATKYGSTNNVIPIRSLRKGFGYYRFELVIFIESYIYSNYVSSMHTTFT